MINYSIVMRSINSNLIEINQAKGRINEAKKNNQTPSADDLALAARQMRIILLCLGNPLVVISNERSEETTRRN